MKDDRRTLGRVAKLVHVEADRRDARDPEVPEWEILAESFHERENEATHAGIDVDIGGSLGPDAGEILDRVDHPMGVLRSGTDDENRSICDRVGRGVDVASVVIGARDKDDIESEVVGGFVKGGVGSVGEDDLAALDTSLGSGPFPGGFDGHQDRFGTTGGHEAGGVITMEQGGHRADHLSLDLAERRDGEGVERVLVEIHRGGVLGDCVHLGSAVVDETEGTPVLPAGVVAAQRPKSFEHLVVAESGVGEGHAQTVEHANS